MDPSYENPVGSGTLTEASIINNFQIRVFYDVYNQMKCFIYSQSDRIFVALEPRRCQLWIYMCFNLQITTVHSLQFSFCDQREEDECYRAL